LKNFAARLLGGSPSLRFDRPEALVKMLNPRTLLLDAPRKILAPLMQKIEFLLVSHFLPSRIRHSV
jgi:hypothetical protein